MLDELKSSIMMELGELYLKRNSQYVCGALTEKTGQVRQGEPLGETG
jgi:hypothetical protein